MNNLNILKNKDKELSNNISEKILNQKIAYDIDNENENEEQNNNNKYSNHSEEEEEENIIEDNPKEKNQKKNFIKESLISPQEFIKLSNNKNKNNINNNNNDDEGYIQKLFSIKSVKCKKHNKDHLKLDENNFEIVCMKCIEEGEESQLEIIKNFDIDKEKDKEKENQLLFNCYKHNESKGSFFCDECKEFICKMCFAEEHRRHRCHVPEVIKNEFVQIIKESIDYLNELCPKLNDSINDIKKIYENLKKQKNDTMKISDNILKIISNNNETEINLLQNKIGEKFMGIDNEIHDNYITYNLLKDKTKKFLEILRKICAEINENKENNYNLCEFHKEKTNILEEIFNFINSSNNFINIRLHNSNNKYDENKEKIENSLNLMNKEILNYEKNSISCILTGRENKSILLRRYVRFSHNEIKYFKSSLIGFASNDNIFLSGLSICGLYLKKKKPKNKDNNTESTENATNNEEPKKENKNEEQDYNNKKILFQITVSTMVNKVEGNILLTQKSELKCVKKSDEPSIIINFEKGVKIKKEKLYLIKVENISDDNYIDIWTGSVGKLQKKNMQIIKCHNSGIQFLFKKAEGIQTDFDEFDQGIIEGILYSINR